MTLQLVVITGASGGIGRAIASRMSREGYGVLILYSSNRAAAELLAQKIRDAGGLAWTQQADLSHDDGIVGLRDRVRRLLDQQPDMELSGLVNNAASMLGPKFGEAQSATFDSYFAVNARAPLLLTQELAPLMFAGGSVVNISSAAAHFASPGDIIYAMTKSALEAFTRHAAPSLARQGVRINSVIPGLTDNGHAAFADPDIRAHMSSFAAMGGVARPSDIAAAVYYLISEESARTTGSAIDVSGGSTIAARPSTSSSLRSLLRDDTGVGPSVRLRHDAVT